MVKTSRNNVVGKMRGGKEGERKEESEDRGEWGKKWGGRGEERCRKKLGVFHLKAYAAPKWGYHYQFYRERSAHHYVGRSAIKTPYQGGLGNGLEI